MEKNIVIFADMTNADATVREGRDPHLNTYCIGALEGQNGWVRISGAITKIVISTPLSEGPKTAQNGSKMGPFPFVYIIRIPIH